MLDCECDGLLSTMYAFCLLRWRRSMQKTAATNSNTMAQKPPTVVTDSRSTCEPFAPRVAAAASARPPTFGGKLTAALGADAGEATGEGEFKLLMEAFASAPAKHQQPSMGHTALIAFLLADPALHAGAPCCPDANLHDRCVCAQLLDAQLQCVHPGRLFADMFAQVRTMACGPELPFTAVIAGGPAVASPSALSISAELSL